MDRWAIAVGEPIDLHFVYATKLHHGVFPNHFRFAFEPWRCLGVCTAQEWRSGQVKVRWRGRAEWLIPLEGNLKAYLDGETVPTQESSLKQMPGIQT